MKFNRPGSLLIWLAIFGALFFVAIILEMLGVLPGSPDDNLSAPAMRLLVR